jgi:DNA-binding IclR family transcriptional regulator
MATDRHSPPTRRVLDVLNLLADDAGQARTLTSIATGLGLSPATCLGILNELANAGYLVRHPDRTYSLGGALVSLGAAARDSRAGIGRARTELRALSDELGRLCTASSVIGDQIVVLEASGPVDEGAPLVRIGSRFPFVAPVGLINAAWESDDAIAGWIGRAPVELQPEKLTRLRSVIASCREQGYSVERLTNVETTLHKILPLALTNVSDDATRRALSEALLIFADRDYLTEELGTTKTSSVSVICAPCFDAGGHPEVVLGIYVMEVDVPIRSIRAMGTRLRTACDAVTASIGGHDPWRSPAVERVR